ncbi:hypothetical protein CBS63078_6421 [Aspergillus niger]|nr:hypothetical protein CBS115989_9428 [Aspergillus niger]KAI2829200.1 hypothetical protein CBS133816_4737 [Aspergillus niger]KAI2837834.1 hypothetical protein CBS11350_8499 [Aspergillus niger]KAI2840647.1 hypothetical protein CBS11232_9028 [Aspergillus niger]KAI2852083.1 hypothetical protein CBS12448_8329 [Aspergillus niger]
MPNTLPSVVASIAVAFMNILSWCRTDLEAGRYLLFHRLFLLRPIELEPPMLRGVACFCSRQVIIEDPQYSIVTLPFFLSSIFHVFWLPSSTLEADPPVPESITWLQDINPRPHGL